MAVPIRKIPVRAVIYIKDVENITGRRDRAARKLLQAIREKFNKPKGGFVTVREFSMHTGIDEDLVREFLID
ncbi:MAG TPA: hypothetical protein VK484_14040 [Ferruginibacter sp.]|nr:hypothetical protein [Ferruginibacter sp.]